MVVYYYKEDYFGQVIKEKGYLPSSSLSRLNYLKDMSYCFYWIACSVIHTGTEKV